MAPRPTSAAVLGLVWAAALAPLPSAAQKIRTNATPNAFEIVGDSLVSAQQLFLGTGTATSKVYIIDKTERNPTQLNGHSVWGSEFDIDTSVARPLDINSNTFCAGGAVLGNGTWLNVGGNQGISYGGLPINATTGNPYQDADGGRSMRLITPNGDGTAAWSETTPMTTRRWYPTLETLEDGSIIIIGGDDWGGYVNDAGQNNPTYEYFPSKGNVTGLSLLTTTLPANLYPLTYLLPSGLLFINANLGNTIFDYKNSVEHNIQDMPHSVRCYPGSAATGMLPLTPANNWTATLVFCGGTNLQPDQWVLTWNIANYPADSTCVRITPDVNTTWSDDDALPEGRSMGNFIFLPDGRAFMLNGISSGTAGYGNTTWAIGQSFGQGPLYMPAYYDPMAAPGSRWYRPADLQPSTVMRMYHSSATLLPDGSIFSSGSNPNADYVPQGVPGYPYFTEYRVERFYPDYYLKPRPQPTGLPTTLGYGGNYFDVTLPASSLNETMAIEQTKVVVIRPGFSTHAQNFGQRYVQLDSTYSNNTDGSAVLHVSQLPPNPAILVPGPAYIFVVVKGVPSIGQSIMVGNGQIGEQQVSNAQALPGTKPLAVSTDQTYNQTIGIATSSSSSSTTSSGGGGGSGGSNGGNNKSAAPPSAPGRFVVEGLVALVAVLGTVLVL